MKRDKFTFYGSWLDAVGHLSGELRGEVLTAIIEYGLYGETNSARGSVTKAILELVKPQIERDRTLYENGCRGGRPMNCTGQDSDRVRTEGSPEPDGNQSETKGKPGGNQTETNPKPKENQTATRGKPNGNQSGSSPEPDETKAKPTPTRARVLTPRDLSLDNINISQENNSGGKEKEGAGGKGKTPAAVPLTYPYSSEAFMSAWETLRRQPKWRKKTVAALQMALKKLGKYPEEYAVLLIENAIAGDYQGVEFSDTRQKFEEWQARTQGVKRQPPDVGRSIDAAREEALRLIREQH